MRHGKIVVDGTSLSGKAWSLRLGYGPNFINTMCRNSGMEETVNFIRGHSSPDVISERLKKRQSRFHVPSLRGIVPHDSPIAHSYRSMVQRCYNEKHDNYHQYGGSGITICNEWLQHPEAFVKWAKENKLRKGYTVDRIDPDKGYSPENCRVLTRSENGKRIRTSNNITICGITDTERGWSKRLNLYPCAIGYMRRSKGLDATMRFIENEMRQSA